MPRSGRAWPPHQQGHTTSCGGDRGPAPSPARQPPYLPLQPGTGSFAPGPVPCPGSWHFAPPSCGPLLLLPGPKSGSAKAVPPPSASRPQVVTTRSRFLSFLTSSLDLAQTYKRQRATNVGRFALRRQPIGTPPYGGPVPPAKAHQRHTALSDRPARRGGRGRASALRRGIGRRMTLAAHSENADMEEVPGSILDRPLARTPANFAGP